MHLPPLLPLKPNATAKLTLTEKVLKFCSKHKNHLGLSSQETEKELTQVFNKATSSGTVTEFKEQKLFTHQLLGLKLHIRNTDGSSHECCYWGKCNT